MVGKFSNIEDGNTPLAEEEAQAAPSSSKIATNGNELSASRLRQRQKSGLEDADKEEVEQERHWLDRDCCHQYPRLCSLIFGVALPLWLIVFISLFAGFFLSKVEAPGEIEANDSFMTARSQAITVAWMATNFTRALPKICFDEYIRRKQNNTDPLDDQLQYAITIEFLRINETLSNNDAGTSLIAAILAAEDQDVDGDTQVTVNLTEFYEFMPKCGAAAAPIQERFVELTNEAVRELSGGLSFNWIRCSRREKGLGRRSFWSRKGQNIEELRPEAQKEFYTETWEAHREELFAEYRQRPPENGTNPERAVWQAFWDAAGNATGGTGCNYNAAATAWFWFTVMTTVGYGNQAPTTTAGRAMLYTLGFLSLLVFGAILARAGQVLSALVDDILVHLHWTFWTRPWASSLMWGSFSYIWMVLIAFNIQSWKEQRLGEPFGFNDGYWFGYISTTTIGLGDIFLEPEVILSKDLFYFPLTFLIGFTYFSAFLGKLAETYSSLSWNQKGPKLIEAMLGRLKKTDLYAAKTIGIISDEVVDKTKGTIEGIKDKTTDIVDHVADKTVGAVSGVTDSLRQAPT